MKMIKEYQLDSEILSPQRRYLPAGAEVVDIQNSERGLMVLAVTEPDEFVVDPPESHTFKICVVGEKINADTVKYLGNFRSSIGIRHVIEIIK